MEKKKAKIDQLSAASQSPRPARSDALEVYREVRDPRDGLKGNDPRGRGRRWGQSWLGWTRVSGGCSVAPS